MNMKQQQERACGACRRKEPCSPRCLQSSSGSLEFDVTKSKENYREGFVLKILGLVSDRIPRSLRAERPHLRIAEDQNKEPGREETHGPGIAHEGPTLRDVAPGENENSCEKNEDSCQMMIKLA